MAFFTSLSSNEPMGCTEWLKTISNSFMTQHVRLSVVGGGDAMICCSCTVCWFVRMHRAPAISYRESGVTHR